MSNHLLVMLHEWPAGELRHDNGSMSFRYLDEYVASDGPAVSQSLPVTDDTYGHRACLAVFGGVLPEEDVRRAVATLLGVSVGNDYKLLEELGGDCAGAIEFVVDGARTSAAEPPILLDAESLDRILRELPQRPIPQATPIADGDHIRMSLAGAQSKLPVIQGAAGVELPGSHGQPSTHIIKPEPARYPNLVANEAFCMTLARALELDVAPVTAAQTLSGLPYLFIERYDRDLRRTPVRRLHQEDFCQALGRLPHQKYQQEGGPTISEMVALLKQVSPAPTKDLGRLWDALVFNVLIGNCDAHGKNYSLLYDGRNPTLAPLYDLVATSIYPDLTRRLAMSIGGANHLDDVTLDAWRECAAQCQLSVTQAIQRMQSIATRALAAADVVAAQILTSSSGGALAITEISDGMRERAQRWGAA